MSILDTGAGGYGAPIAEVMPDVTVSATDAFPSPTFRDYYLPQKSCPSKTARRNRGCAGGRRIEIATNIHQLFRNARQARSTGGVATPARRPVDHVPNISAPDGRRLTKQGETWTPSSRDTAISAACATRDPAMRWGVDGSNVLTRTSPKFS
jgi:hypothetical protein